MAIASIRYQTRKVLGTSTSAGATFDATGGDFLVATAYQDPSGGNVNSMTYNGVAMTKVATFTDPANAGAAMEFWVLKAPTTGSNTLTLSSTVSISKIYALALYSGVKQTNTANTTGTLSMSGSGNQVASLTTTVPGCWTLATYIQDTASMDGFVNCTYGNGDSVTTNYNLADSTATVGVAGTYTIGFHPTGSTTGMVLAIAIEPSLTPVLDSVQLWGGGGGGCGGTSGFTGSSSGGYVAKTNESIVPGSYTITVATGGTGGSTTTAGTGGTGYATGGNGSAAIALAGGGGGGGSSAAILSSNTYIAAGGGGAGYNGDGTSPSSTTGGNGGNGVTGQGSPGGGGAAATNGANANQTSTPGSPGGGGAGGTGATTVTGVGATSNAQSGSSAAGASGNGHASTPTSNGGNGSGGATGGTYGASPTNGADGTGSDSGGGGGGASGTAIPGNGGRPGGGAGGSGLNITAGTGGGGRVIIKYTTANFGTCTGGTITTSGLQTIHTFNSSGTFTLVALTTSSGNFLAFM